MQVRTVRGGEDAFNALLYPPPSANLVNHLANKLEHVRDKLGAAGTAFMNVASGFHNRFSSATNISNAKLLVQQATTGGCAAVIRRYEFDNIHTANPLMQGYILANPAINHLYSNQLCDGFEDTYVDTQPWATGVDRHDYQRVMDGILQFDNSGNGYYETFSNDDEIAPLDFIEQCTILDTWSEALRMLAEDIDPTSTTRASL